jgi:4-diphosphocytidyl-2C-methyl-D-erythritol kinase
MVTTGPTAFSRGTKFWREAITKEKETLKEHKDLTSFMTGTGSTFIGMGKSFNALRAMESMRPKTGAI